MKIITSLAIAANIVVVASMGYLYKSEVTKVSIKETEVTFITQEVGKQLEAARQHHCLAMNIYHEARNEGLTGQRAVAWATLNRVESPKYPNTICEVVYQAVLNENGIPKRNRCSFSWFCDGKSDEVTDQAAWNVAEVVAADVMAKYGRETDPTNGAIMYHAHYVTPYWASSYDKQARIDSHIFYN